MMKEIDVSVDEVEFRMFEFNLDEFMGIEFGFLISMRCWEGEVEVEDWWGIGLLLMRLYSWFLYDVF